MLFSLTRKLSRETVSSKFNHTLKEHSYIIMTFNDLREIGKLIEVKKASEKIGIIKQTA